MKTLIIKHSIKLNGHKTSVSLENEFWDGLCEIARQKHVTISALVRTIETGRNNNNLSSTIRVFVLNYFQTSVGQKAFHTTDPAWTVAPQAGPP